MEFNSSCDQTNFMGYYPPPSIDYPNSGWEYHQGITDSEHSNQWRYASELQDEQENHMGYCPQPHNDSSHYPNGGWEYHQEMRDYEQSNQCGDANQDNSMGYYPTPQNDSCHYANGRWEYQ
ncbi:hypothetical protein AHAS_Ahas13G0288700 [Arachis hypogaea]